MSRWSDPRCRDVAVWSAGWAALAMAVCIPVFVYSALADLGNARLWTVRDVSVMGMERLSDAEILVTAGLDRPRNLLSIRPSEMVEALEARDWIAHADVEVDWRGRVSVAVVEREAAMVVFGAVPVLVDRSGATIRGWDPVEDAMIPMLVPEQSGPNWRSARVHLAHDLAEAWRTEPGLGVLSEIHDEGAHGWRVVDAAGVETQLPPTGWAERLADVARVREDAARRGLAVAAVLADGDHATRVTVRITTNEGAQ